MNLTGLKFGRLTAIKPATPPPGLVLPRSKTAGPGKNGVVYWEFRCDCGATIYRPSFQVSGGKIRSCGCLIRDSWDRQRKVKPVRPAPVSKMDTVERLSQTGIRLGR